MKKEEIRLVEKTKFIKGRRFLIALAGIIIFFLLENILFVYNASNKSRPIFGQRLSGARVSELNDQQITKLIDSRLKKDSPLRLQYKGKTFAVTQVDVGAKIDYKKVLRDLHKVGRDRSTTQNILTQNKALFGLSNATLSGKLSQSLLVIKVLSIADDVNTDPKPPMPDFQGNLKTVIPQKNGVKVDTANLTRLISNNVFSPPFFAPTIPAKEIIKKFPNYDMDAIRRQANESTHEPISIKSGGIVLTLTSKDLVSLLTVTAQPNPKDPKKTVMTLSLDRQKLTQKLYPYAVEVEKATNAEFNDHDSRVAIYSQFYTGTRRLIEVPTGSAFPPKVLGVANQAGEKIAYLTFDDGPNIIYHPMLLDILRDKNVKATFYFVGSSSKLYESTTKRTVKEGHVLGDHTQTHSYLAKLLPSQVYDEIKKTQDILNTFLESAKKITLFRPPYGGTSPAVEKVALNLGLKQELWTVDPKDWSDPSTEELVNRVVGSTKQGSVILLHSNHFSTVKALPGIIDKLKELGFQFRVQE